jgi:hypothetical protein
LFTQATTVFEKHEDDDYTDFYRERGIPQMLSHVGPCADTADVNGDGLTDIYIGGTVKKQGQLYLQNSKGSFIKKDVAEFKKYTGFTDGAVLFFDCDKDNDKDLLLCSAGNVFSAAARELQHRLYVNNGKGDFTISVTAFPSNNDNISTAATNDFDSDGDLDLFIGAGCVTGNYGLTPQSHIYINNGKGAFADMSADLCKEIQQAGMVTGAVWANADNDNAAELVIVGQWMTPLIFKYTNGRFVKIKSSLDNLHGWWQTVAATDLNADGKTDFIFGNLGENFYLNPSMQNPLKLFVNDFDGNGFTDKIITRTIDGKDKPVFMKGEMEAQMPLLKKQNLRNKDYAVKTIQQLFSEEKINGALVKKINYASSCVAVSSANGSFTINVLPVEAQFSLIKTILPADVNSDGLTDLILAGNEYGFQPQLGRLDANDGVVLLNDGKGNFKNLDKKYCGINVSGQVRTLVSIKTKFGSNIVFLRNNELPILYKQTK